MTDAVRHIWPEGEYERALDLINRGYDKQIVAQIIGRTINQLNDKLRYELMEDNKRQQRRERADELRKRGSATPDGPRKNYRTQVRGIEHAPASVVSPLRQAVRRSKALAQHPLQSHDHARERGTIAAEGRSSS